MIIEIEVPGVGESVQEAMLAEWFKQDGDMVEKDEDLFVLETDKVTLEVAAEASGRLSIKVQAGESVSIGDVVGTIDTDAAETKETDQEPVKKKKEAEKGEETKKAEEEALAEKKRDEKDAGETDKRKEKAEEEKSQSIEAVAPSRTEGDARIGMAAASPSVRRLASENKVDFSKIEGTGFDGRITESDVLSHLKKPSAEGPKEKRREKKWPEEDSDITRKKMSPIRRRIAERLLEAKRNTAMLTTFNEIDMQRVIELRNAYKDDFKSTHKVSLGFMSFFMKACVEALKAFPEVNAFVDGEEIVYHNYYHIGIAVGSGRGLVVPVVRHVERLGFDEMEKSIVDYVKKIEENQLELADLEGGTFTITNGGVFGSLLSTPILNTPQSGILGMHKIEKRPVVINDEIVIRPMMYVALSYDHRIVDGREAVSFLKRVKEFIENPERMMLGI